MGSLWQEKNQLSLKIIKQLFNELHQIETHWTNILIKFKMNKIVNKSLLTGEDFMSELHLRHPGFSYSAWGEFPNIVKEFKNSEKQVTQNIYIAMN